MIEAQQLVWNALEARQVNGKHGPSMQNARNMIESDRRQLLRFLESLDVDMTIGELRDALDNYEPGFGDN